MKKTGRRTTRHYATLGIGFVPCCSGWRNREKPELMGLAKIEKWIESKMIWCLEIALTRLEKVEKWLERWFSALRWPYTRLIEVEKQVEIKVIWCFDVALYQSCKSRMKKWFSEDLYLALYVHLSCLWLSLSLSLILPFCLFWVIKGKEKEQNVFLYTSVLLLSVYPCIQHCW